MDGGKRQKHSTPLCGSARRAFDWSYRLIAWFMGCDLGRVRIIVFGRVSIASILLPGSAPRAFILTAAPSRAPERGLACARCLTPHAHRVPTRRAGNMTLLGAGSRQSERSCILDRVARRSFGLPQPDFDFLDRRHPRPCFTTQAAVAGAEQRSRRCRPIRINPQG